MIGSLHGIVVEVEPSGDHAVDAVVDVQGVGYRVTCTARCAGGFRVGDEVALSVHTHVREAAIQLFGFADRAERQTFELLLGAHGVGPALALAILGALGPQDLIAAVAGADLDALMLVPGVGRKTAQRLQVELAGRFEVASIPFAEVGGNGAGRSASKAEVREALAALGYGSEEIRHAVDALPSDGAVEELLREALAILAPSR